MNRTTVKRGIGAVILALIAAGLLAFLLKDKAAQRQEVVEIALPGTNGGSTTQASGQSTPLPTLTMDNSNNGSVIANAGSGNGEAATNGANTATNSTIAGSTNGTASANNADGTVVASAAAVGAAATAGASSIANGVASGTGKTMDFSVKPKPASKASSEFLDLDLVNNGTKATTAGTTANAPAATVKADASSQAAASNQAANNDQGIVIASTKPRANGTVANTVQPRLIGEKKSAPVKSASTAKVITKKAPPKAAPSQPETSEAQAKNGYAIQLLATSSLARANNLKKVMAGEGYPTYVTKTTHNGKTLYRVRIGQYKAKAQAAKAQAAMKRRYKKNANVNRSAVVAR